MKYIIAFLALFAAFEVHGQLIDISIISKIESNNNPYAYNPVGGGSHGLLQIAPICLRAFNTAHQTHYKIKDLYNPRINRTIALWALNDEIPRMLKNAGKEVTVENVLTAYNAGISYVIRNKPLPAITRKYIEKYNSLNEHPRDP